MARMRPYDPTDREPYIWRDICNVCGAILELPATPGEKLHGKCPACGVQYGVLPHEAI